MSRASCGTNTMDGGEEVCASLRLWSLPSSTAQHCSTCWGISLQQITLLTHGPGTPSPPPPLLHTRHQSSIPKEGQLCKRLEKKRLIKFPWPPFPTTSFRSKAQRQVPICKAAPGNTWPPAQHNERETGCEKGFSSSNSENVSLPDSLINPSLCAAHPFSSPTSKPKPVWLEFYLPHVQFLLSDQPFWTGNFTMRGNIPCCPGACVSNTKIITLAIKKLINYKVCAT